MLDYLVLYQSGSGNTKKIAASIFSRLPGNSKDLIDIDTDKTIPEANVYFIGFCVHRGSCSMEVSDFLSDLSGKQIALFGTCGMGDSPEYYKDITRQCLDRSRQRLSWIFYLSGKDAAEGTYEV